MPRKSFIQKTLQELISLPSLSGQEQRIARYVATKCGQAGHKIIRIHDSLAVHIPGQDRSRALLFNGHYDTVPTSPEWTSDPLKLHQDPHDADRLIGLGASDMKSGIALMLDVSRELAMHPPQCDVWLLFADNEETDNAGSKAMADWFAAEARCNYQTVGGLILEPTDAAYIAPGHRGVGNWNITADGPGGHASKHFEDEVPALEKISRFFAAFPEIRQEWEQLYSDPMLGKPWLNPTILHAGDTMNVVPLHAEATMNLRITPKLAEKLAGIRRGWEKTFGITIHELWKPQPTVCSPGEHIYKTAQAALPHVPFKPFPGATDQRVFAVQQIPMLIFGPGCVAAMHQPNEWVHISAMNTCRQHIAAIMQRF